jgi:hypothetical protein
MPYTVNGVAIGRTKSLEGVEEVSETFLSCLSVFRGCIGQIPVFLNVFEMFFNIKVSI